MRRKTFRLSWLSMMLVAGFSQMSFIRVRKVPSIPSSLRISIMNGFWICRMFVFCIYWGDGMIFILFSVNVVNYKFVWMLNQSCITEATIIWLLSDIVVDLEMYHPDLQPKLTQLRLILKELKEDAVCWLHSPQMGRISRREIPTDNRTCAMPLVGDRSRKREEETELSFVYLCSPAHFY